MRHRVEGRCMAGVLLPQRLGADVLPAGGAEERTETSCPGLLALSLPSCCVNDYGDLTICWEPPCSWLAFSDAPSLTAAFGKLSASTFHKKWWQFSRQDVSSLFAALIQATHCLEACPHLVPPWPLPAESQSHLIAPLLRAC